MKIQLASNWANDYLSTTLASTELNVSKSEREALSEFVQYLKNMDPIEDKGELANAIQTEIFSIARKLDLQPRVFFKLLYRILINADKGPRVGNYVSDMGIRWAYEQLNNFCKSSSSEAKAS